MRSRNHDPVDARAQMERHLQQTVQALEAVEELAARWHRHCDQARDGDRWWQGACEGYVQAIGLIISSPPGKVRAALESGQL